MSETDKKFRTALDFLLKQEGRTAQARLSKEKGIDSGYLNSILKGRKPGSIAVKDKIASHFELEYEDMLILGRWILSGNQGESWKPTDSLSGEDPIATMSEQDDLQDTHPPAHKQDNVYPVSKTIDHDKNMQLIFEWVSQQDVPGDFWILLKMTLARKYPDFDTWLKKRSSGDHQDRLPEEQSIVGG